ncbi:uncharacterized protein LOC107407188 [Ziziphus jujuba]|uniref:Uncharacterized protein LOC107407188 n=1 Tax=Ziziphus jujuba TaxID=326968 RepID=A0A6P3Z4G6_ZIZJJ|nr:uncharacterized protein LOC107407188 [Ziziphus jujuba]
MAQSLDDAEFWLPPKFLTDDDVLMDKDGFDKNGGGGGTTGFGHSHDGFPSEFPYEFDSFSSNSALSSPVESVVGSMEAESSDEEEFLFGLTRRLAQSTLHDSQKLAVTSFPQDKHEMVLSGSPQSTLSGIGSWCARSTISSDGSPNGPSQVPSPPTTPFGARNDTWDLIYEAAGQVARLKMTDEETKFSNRGKGLLGPHGSPNPSVPCVRNPNSGLYKNNNQGFSQNLARLQQVRPDQALKSQCSAAWVREVKNGWAHNHNHNHHNQNQQQIRNRGRNIGHERAMNLPHSVWRPQQIQQPQHTDTAMRAVLLGGSGVKRECSGTGVFLPRKYGNPPESRKKTGCTTVLLPAKVVQALNLNVEAVNHGQAQPRFGTGFSPDHEVLMARRNALLAQQRRSLRPEGTLNHEVRLPQEWTY